MTNNINLIKGLELVNVTKESMLNSHTPEEYGVAGLMIVFLLYVLVLGLVCCIRIYKQEEYSLGIIGITITSILISILLFAGIITTDVGIRDLRAQSRGEENCVIMGMECSREVLEVKVDEEEVGEIGVGEFMGEFVRKYEIVEIGDNGVWKVIVRE